MRRCAYMRMWRDEEVRMWSGEDVRMWRWSDVKKSRCEDVRCEGVKMSGCQDAKLRSCEDDRRWEDKHMWRSKDGWQIPTIRKTLRSNAFRIKKYSNSVSFKLYCYKQPLPLLASNPSAACSSAGQEDSAGTTDLRPQLWAQRRLSK